MTKKKETEKVVETETKERIINVIILQQSKSDVIKHDQAHYFIKKSGEIVEGLSIDKAGKHCEDNDEESIGIILEGFHYSPAQQAALMNIIYTCNSKVGKELTVKPYNVFHPGKVNPNLNLRSLMNRYASSYGKK